MKINREMKAIIDDLKKDKAELNKFESEISKKEAKLSELRNGGKLDMKSVEQQQGLESQITMSRALLEDHKAKYQRKRETALKRLENLRNKDIQSEIFNNTKLIKKKEQLYQLIKDTKKAHTAYIDELSGLWEEYRQLYADLGHDNIHGSQPLRMTEAFHTVRQDDLDSLVHSMK